MPPELTMHLAKAIAVPWILQIWLLYLCKDLHAIFYNVCKFSSCTYSYPNEGVSEIAALEQLLLIESSSFKFAEYQSNAENIAQCYIE